MIAIQRIRPDLRVRLLVSEHNAEALSSDLHYETTVVRYKGTLMRLLYEQTILPFKGSEDLLYCPSNFCPLIKTKRPVVVTLQNANHFGPGRRLGGARIRKLVEIALAQISARRADRVIVISLSLLRYLREDRIHHDRLRYIPSGVPHWPNESIAPSGMPTTGDFFVSLTSDSQYKHIPLLVRAWASAYGGTPNPPHLVLVGRISPESCRAYESLIETSLRDNLLCLGTVSVRAHIKWLLENARAMVSTSALEAFPLPPLEALSLGCPTILSDIPAHRETGGSLAQYFPVGDIAALTKMIIQTPQRSHSQVSLDGEWFSWDDNAYALGEVFDELSLGRNDR